MEISLSRFLQLTAMLATGGTLATACTVNNIHDQSSTGGTTGTSNTATGGAAAGTSSSLVGGSTYAGASNASGGTTTNGTATGGTSSLATGGATTAATSTGGSSGVAGSPGTGGATTTATSTGGSTVVVSSTGTGGNGTGGCNCTGGSRAVTGGTSGTAVAGGTATGGKTGTGGTTGTVAATGGLAATGGMAATGGGTSNSCVSGDPAGEGLGFDCTTLSYATEQCPDPTGEGTVATYGVLMCEAYAAGHVDSVKVLTDCLETLTQPTSGWCGAEHKAAVDACVSQMLTRTCPNSTAQAACVGIHSDCSTVSVANCVADLSPLADAKIAYVGPCMEGAAALVCGYEYRGCVGLPDQSLSISSSCTQLVQACTGVTLQDCETKLDPGATGSVAESTFMWFGVCMQADMDTGSTCSEAFTACSP